MTIKVACGLYPLLYNVYQIMCKVSQNSLSFFLLSEIFSIESMFYLTLLSFDLYNMNLIVLKHHFLSLCQIVSSRESIYSEFVHICFCENVLLWLFLFKDFELEVMVFTSHLTTRYFFQVHCDEMWLFVGICDDF